MKLAGENLPVLRQTADLLAGIIGLRCHRLCVANLIAERTYAFRDPGTSYTWSDTVTFHTMPRVVWDPDEESLRTALLTVAPNHAARTPAAMVLAWLLRAWGDRDFVNHFVSLFIPLEMVLAGIDPSPDETLKSEKLRALVEEHMKEDRDALLDYIKQLGPPLAARFVTLATQAALPGWEADITAFRAFNKIRNALLHRGQTPTVASVPVTKTELRTLEGLVERYVNYHLFRDDQVYSRGGHRPDEASGGSVH